jgi:pyruvate dehydrogenase E2 component (dihydrolipoamide acetyltransferase)
MGLNLSTKVLYTTLVLKRKCSTIDSLLAIIGPAGTDISGIAANFKAGAKTEDNSTIEAKAATTETVAPVAQEESTDGKNSSIMAKKIASDKIQLNQVKGSGEMDVL